MLLAALFALGPISCGGWNSPSPVCLAGAHLDDRGRCVAQDAPEHHLPFGAGSEVRVTQAYHGYQTHRNDVAYSIDFACDEGEPVRASRSGVVWSVRDDSRTGCADPECVDDANYVLLDHGDGTFSTYYHLRHKGVVVEPGQQVCQGQLLGLCGDTGYATGPHLHFSVVDARWKSIPVSFLEARGDGVGILLPRYEYESENVRQWRCDDTHYSRLGRDAFIHRGIILDEEIPMVVEADGDRTMRIEGQYTGDNDRVAIHRREINGGDWIEQCTELDGDRFSVEIDWPRSVFTEGYYFMMITGADEGCSSAGWAWSYRIRVW